MTTDNKSTLVITGVARLSYCHLFTPQKNDSGEEKYSVSILIPKSDKETLRKIKAAVDIAKEIAKARYGDASI